MYATVSSNPAARQPRRAKRLDPLLYTERSPLLSHHARGVVSAVCCSVSVVAEESKSDRFWFHGMSAFSTTIGGSKKTAPVSHTRRSRRTRTKFDILAGFPDGA